MVSPSLPCQALGKSPTLADLPPQPVRSWMPALASASHAPCFPAVLPLPSDAF